MPGETEKAGVPGQPLTYKQLYRRAVTRLQEAGCESPAFDAACLLEDIGGLPRQGIPLLDERQVTPQTVDKVMKAVEQRAAGRPLQYIVGEWDFLSLTLAVGEGVLIPRPDTECLCEAVAEWLNRHSRAAQVLDLCAGSGCVGLGIASLCRVPVTVTAVEWSEEAWGFLTQNMARYPGYAVKAVRADVLRDAPRFSSGWTAIVSNPPYIPTADLETLMPEVRHEPRVALDGAADGLRFYRTIAADWVPHLASGGLCAVEVGIHQAQAVCGILEASGLHSIRVVDDLAGIPRVVMGKKE